VVHSEFREREREELRYLPRPATLRALRVGLIHSLS
jgi:hypothetical protein